jgi:hypothetical protein
VMGGAAKEGVTEATQRVIELATVAHALGGEAPTEAAINAVFADIQKGTESTILESGVRGALPGAVFGAGSVFQSETAPAGTPAPSSDPLARVIELDALDDVPDAPGAAPVVVAEVVPTTATSDTPLPVTAGPVPTVGQETEVPTGIAASEVPKGGATGKPADVAAEEFDPYQFATYFAEANEAIPTDLTPEQSQAAAAEATEIAGAVAAEIETARANLRPEQEQSQFPSDRRAFFDRKAKLSALEARLISNLNSKLRRSSPPISWAFPPSPNSPRPPKVKRLSKPLRVIRP